MSAILTQRLVVLGGMGPGGTYLFANGTAAAPSISFLSEPSTGFFLPTAFHIGVTLGGTERWRFQNVASSSSLQAMQASIYLRNSSNEDILSVVSGAVTLSARGTNQNITLTPSGTGNLFSTRSLILKASYADSSNGKLQLDTHTANTGGIGFGTDMALHRDSAGGLTLDTSAGAVGIKFSRALTSGAILGQIYFDTALGFIGTTGGHPFHLRSNGTIALTVDTSLRTILAGALRLSNAAVASGAVVNTHTVTVQDSTGTTYRLLCLV